MGCTGAGACTHRQVGVRPGNNTGNQSRRGAVPSTLFACNVSSAPVDVFYFHNG